MLAGLAAIMGHCEVNPYSQAITNRNVFALKDAPPPPPPAEATPPASKITLIGIANVMGQKKAVLKVQAVPGTPPKGASHDQPMTGQEPPLVLVEGVMQEGVKVISIDEVSGNVQIDNNGQVSVLTFENDGLKVPSGAASPSTSPGSQGRQPDQMGIPRPSGLANALGGTGTPTGQMSAAPSVSGNTAALAGVSGAPVGGTGSPGWGGATGLPQRELRSQQRPMSAEEAFLLTEVNRERNDSLIKAGVLPRMPPPIRGLQPELAQPPTTR